jgi:hypothetical protein
MNCGAITIKGFSDFANNYDQAKQGSQAGRPWDEKKRD